MLSEIERFVNWTRRRNPDARTWRDYGYDLRQFANSVKKNEPGKVEFSDIDSFIIDQLNQGFKATTINRHLAAILSFYTFLADDDPTLVCPVRMHRHHLREPQHLPRPVQEDDLRSFFACVSDSSDKAMFALMLRCGLRISEVAALRLCDLYLSEPRPRLLIRGKGSRERSVYLSPQAEHILRIYLFERPKTSSDFVFLSYQMRGMSTTSIHKRLIRYRDQAKVKLTAHQLRHSFANDLLCAEVPVTTIQKLLGHRWLETTQVYVAANDIQVQADYYTACLKLEGWFL